MSSFRSLGPVDNRLKCLRGRGDVPSNEATYGRRHDFRMLKQKHVAAALDLADLAIRESHRETHLETLQLLSRYSLALGWSERFGWQVPKGNKQQEPRWRPRLSWLIMQRPP